MRRRAPRASRSPDAVGAPRAPRDLRPRLGGLILTPLLVALAGCGPEAGDRAMLDPGRPMLDGAPASGRRTATTDPQVAGMVEMLARDRELISQGLNAPADPRRPATAATPAPAPAAAAAAAATIASAADEPAAPTVPPPRWHQGESRPPAARNVDARDLSFSIDPPSLASTGERRRTGARDSTDGRDTAARLAEAMADALNDERDATTPWLDPADRPVDATAARPTARDRDRDRDGDRPAADDRPGSSLASPERRLPAERVAVARADLMLALEVDAIDHPDRALANALLAALGTVGDPDASLDPSMFRQVPDTDRDLVEAFVAFASDITPTVVRPATADDPSSDTAGARTPPAVDRDALLAAIDQLRSRVARTPQLAIQRAALCRQVDGFGVFEPLTTPHRFLAGSPNAFIVYVEVDEFHSEQRDGRDWVTELEQRVQIYNDRDARPVWATDWSEVVDVNANRRRDFFTAQIIELPDAFSLGVFHLKIQVRDTLTGAEAETSVEFEMVAGGSGLPIR